MKKRKILPKRYWLIGGVVGLLIAVAGAAWLWRPVAYLPDVVVKMPAAEVAARQARIVEIYNSLKLPALYAQVDENIFGEKRLYGWDHSRSYSSSRSYVRDATPSATLAELRPRIEAAGFTFVDEPYPNQIDKELQYKSAKGEYLRLQISSKPRDDALRAAGPHGDITKTPDGTGGPSNVVIKVNLDDNNE